MPTYYNPTNNPAIEVLSSFIDEMKRSDKMYINRLDEYTMSFGAKCAALYWTDSIKPMEVLLQLLSFFKEEQATYGGRWDRWGKNMTLEQLLPFLMDAEEHTYMNRQGKVLAFPRIPAPAYSMEPAIG